MQIVSSKRKHSIDFVFPIVLFLVFSLAAISVILFAARVYKREVEVSQQHYNTRTSLEYLTEKVHRYDAEGAVSVGSFWGSTLILKDTDSDGRYVTYIYCMDGSLKELFALEGAVVDPAAGTNILPLESLTAELINDHLVRLTCTDADGLTQSALVAVRSEKKNAA